MDGLVGVCKMSMPVHSRGWGLKLVHVVVEWPLRSFTNFCFQIDVYYLHAATIFDYKRSVEDTIEKNEKVIVNVYRQMLRESGDLEAVENVFSPTDRPWMFVCLSASILSKESQFFVVEKNVSLNSQYFWKWTNANPMKIFGQLVSHPKLLIGSKLSLG